MSLSLHHNLIAKRDILHQEEGIVADLDEETAAKEDIRILRKS